MKWAVIAFAGLLLAGCSKQDDKRGVPKRESPMFGTVSGSVFIVTKNGDSIKLGLVPVLVFTEHQFLSVSNYAQGGIAKTLAKLKTEIATVEQKVIELSGEMQKLSGEADMLSGKFDSQMKSLEYYKKRQDYDTALKFATAAEETAKKRREVRDKVDSTRNRIIEHQGLVVQYMEMWPRLNASHYFDFLPTPIASAKTDADGKFALTVPGGHYYIMARSSREGVVKEEYFWASKITVENEVNRSVMLSNDNLIGRDSPEVAVSLFKAF